ncbi:MAG: hypothetical protein IKG61_08995 [Selenomonadaceae bacterium]|nr:hypothetical protein [Selenomonadaceae bacterium]
MAMIHVDKEHVIKISFFADKLEDVTGTDCTALTVKKHALTVGRHQTRQISYFAPRYSF